MNYYLTYQDRELKLFPSQHQSQGQSHNLSMTNKKHTVYCNRCQRDCTFSEVVGDAVNVDPKNEPQNDNAHRLIYRLLQCDRCGLEITFFMDYMGVSGYFPQREMPTEEPFNSLPNNLHKIYREVFRSLHIGARILSAMGIRAIVEGLCASQEVNDGPTESGRKTNLEGKINGLMEKGIINAQQCVALHSIRFMGNEAAHELEEPSSEEVILALSILDSILRSTFELPKKVDSLAKSRGGYDLEKVLKIVREKPKEKTPGKSEGGKG